MKNYSKVLALCLVLGVSSYSQVFSQVIKYKRNALEIKAGVGGTFFFGDLGGSHRERRMAFLTLM
ncbi:MAG: hypothetical protein ACI9JN_000602 [Bacteroidia bacterium]|jgi:hypothetical protein